MADLPGEGRVVKRFRVAREGQTVDDRKLTRQEIIDMAATYNMDELGGRINCEHIDGFSPQPPFNAYGDILLVDYTIENGLACLYNTISALPNLLAINKLGQKIYPSIEFQRNFAGTGKTYQVGLALTDNPASRGTEAIKFSGTYTQRTIPDNEIFLMNTQATTPAAQVNETDSKTLMEKLTAFLSTKPAEPEKPDLLTATADSVVKLASIFTDIQKELAAIRKDISDLKKAAPKTEKQSQENADTVAAAAAAAATTAPAANETETPKTPEEKYAALEAKFDALTTLLSTQPANGRPPLVTGAQAYENDF